MRITLYNTDLKEAIAKVVLQAKTEKLIKSKKDIGRVIIHAKGSYGINITLTDTKDQRILSVLH